VDHVKTNKHIFKIFHRRVSTPFWYFHTKRGGDIPTGTPLTGASNAGWVGKNCDSEVHCLLLMMHQARCCQHGWRWTTATAPQVVTQHIASSKRLIVGEDDEMFMTRSLDVTPKTTKQHI